MNTPKILDALDKEYQQVVNGAKYDTLVSATVSI